MERCYLNLHPDQTLGRSQCHSAVRKSGKIALHLPGRKKLKVSESQDSQLGTF